MVRIGISQEDNYKNNYQLWNGKIPIKIKELETINSKEKEFLQYLSIKVHCIS